MTFNFHYSLVAAILVLFFGKYLNQKSGFLRAYNIPSPVIGDLVILLLGAIVCLFLQNLTGAGIADLLGLSPVVGVLGSSVALSGGHSTEIAWADVFVQQYGIPNAMEIGIACATFGLVLGGVAGGPVAHWLIQRHQLRLTSDEPITVGFRYDSHPSIDVDSVLWVFLQIGMAAALGMYLQGAIAVLG
jgi:glutamate:Na+ symporter, ESS family